MEDFLQPGINQVAAVCCYGTSTMLVYTEHGVNGFTLNPAIGTFIYHTLIWSLQRRSYLLYQWRELHSFSTRLKITSNTVRPRGEDRPYTSRYIGSLVSDIHRNIIKGGNLYLPKFKAPNGKLRLYMNVILWRLLWSKLE
jgi:fructose-1,6-bisphosphatase I